MNDSFDVVVVKENFISYRPMGQRGFLCIYLCAGSGFRSRFKN